MAWLDGLRWPQAAAFGDAERTRLVVDGELAGFSKRAGSLTALWVHRAGHLVRSLPSRRATEYYLTGTAQRGRPSTLIRPLPFTQVSIDYPAAAMEILRLVTRFDVPTS